MQSGGHFAQVRMAVSFGYSEILVVREHINSRIAKAQSGHRIPVSGIYAPLFITIDQDDNIAIL